MNCNNCGKSIDSESNYCKHCGFNLNPLATNPHSTIFDSSYQAHTKSNTDLGFLIILIIIVVNVLFWALWSFIGNSLANYRTNIMVLRIVGAASVATQLIVMLTFTKRKNYRIVIGILGALIILYEIYSLIWSLTILR